MRGERGGFHLLHIDLRLFMMRQEEFALLSNLNASLNCHEPPEGNLPGSGTEYKGRRKSKRAGATLVEERVGERTKN